MTLRTNKSSGTNPIFYLVVSFTNLKNSGSFFYLASAFGNKSSISLVKMGLSSVTILGILKSLRALIKSGSSGISESSLFNLPAYLSTDLTALSPQS